MKEYDDKQVQKRIDEAVKTALESNPFGIENKLPEIYCRNCGRSVYVGRCCPAPDIQNMERPDPEIMRIATEFVDLTVTRQEGETFPAYFLRKVKARRNKIAELESQGDVWFPPKGSDTRRNADVMVTVASCPPRGKELTIDYAKEREKQGLHIDVESYNPPVTMGRLVTVRSNATPGEIQAMLDSGMTIGLISYESELDMEKYRTMLAKATEQPRVLSSEVFDRVIDICNNPGEPSQALKDLMSRKKKDGGI